MCDTIKHGLQHPPSSLHPPAASNQPCSPTTSGGLLLLHASWLKMMMGQGMSTTLLHASLALEQERDPCGPAAAFHGGTMICLLSMLCKSHVVLTCCSKRCLRTTHSMLVCHLPDSNASTCKQPNQNKTCTQPDQDIFVTSTLPVIQQLPSLCIMPTAESHHTMKHLPTATASLLLYLLQLTVCTIYIHRKD